MDEQGSRSIEPDVSRTPNADKAYEFALHNITALFDAGEDELAHSRAYDLHEDPHLPLAIRPTCCSILANGDGEYLKFANEAVEDYTTIVDCNPTNATMVELLREARNILSDAHIDAAAEEEEKKLMSPESQQDQVIWTDDMLKDLKIDLGLPVDREAQSNTFDWEEAADLKDSSFDTGIPVDTKARGRRVQ